MSLVLDSSLTLAFFFEDEATPETDDVLDSLGKGAKAVTPAIWNWEVGNVLLLAERRKRITPAEAHQHLTALGTLPIEVDTDAQRAAWNATFLLAKKHQLTLYDAAYLELAIRRGFPLGSLDTDLRKAAKAEGVQLLPK